MDAMCVHISFISITVHIAEHFQVITNAMNFLAPVKHIANSIAPEKANRLFTIVKPLLYGYKIEHFI